ncbi:MAG: LacI family DNA-binding transcriptional regulator [Leifsonia flava]
MTTMVKVAEVAGVSISTVSHVLNGTRHVEPETRDRVLAAIEQTSYRQDALARAMRRSQTDTIGLIVSDAGEPAFAEMVHGVEHAAAALGFTLLLANSAENADREQQAVEALLERRVDGLIIARAAASHAATINELSRQDKPVVLMDRLSDLDVDQVGVENHEAARDLTRHLLAQGHRRIALIAGDTTVPTLRERRDGFTEAVALHDVDTETVVIDESELDQLSVRIGEMLDSSAPPTAVIACSTVLAARCLAAIQARGLSIPDAIAFAAFDGFAYSDLFTPQITTVRQPAFEVGTTAVKLLADRMSKSESGPTSVRLKPVIEYRHSTETGPRHP